MRNVERTLFFAACMLLALLAGCSDDNPPTPDAGTFGNAPVAGSSGGGSGSGSNAGTSGVLCPEGFARATRVTPRVILVLDGSCSMSTDYPANGQMSSSRCEQNDNGRWTALRNALIDPQTGVVTGLQSAVEFGLAVYGTEPTCPIPGMAITPALNNLTAIEGGLPQVQPGMYTPTGPALDWVYENMIDTNVGPDAEKHPTIVILATDGEPNSCGDMGGGGVRTDYQPSIDAITRGAGLGIKTYVVSLADATGAFHDHLQQLANIGAGVAAGGTNAKLYEPGTPQELSADLQLVVGGAVGCDIALDGELAAAEACQGQVSIGTDPPLACNDANGWVLADSRHIRLQGTACQKLMTTPDATVQASFPCGVFTVD